MRLPVSRCPAEALAVAAASLGRTGLFLLGEVHGVAQTPLAILALSRRLGVRALAFEWSYDELDDVVQPVLATGTVAHDALWKLPPSAEVFSGDGRLTAGHVRLLEGLGDQLDRIVLLDRVGSDGAKREIGMELPGVANGVLAPSAGTCWFHGEQEPPSGELPLADAVVSLGVAYPAVVPQHPLGATKCTELEPGARLGVPSCVVPRGTLETLDDSEPLGDDQSFVTERLVCPELLVSAAPVSQSLESLSLVEGEGKIDIGGAHHANLCRLEDGNGLIVEAEHCAPGAEPWQRVIGMRPALRPQPGCCGLVAAEHRVD
jgi:hypothetical protein